MSSDRGRILGRRAGLAALATSSALVLIPAGAFGRAGAASTRTVILKEIRFRPATLNIRRGDSVTWVWRDGGTRHNVTFQGFHSRTQASGSYSVRFTHSGTFNYRCTIHVGSGMTGKIVVH